MQSGTPDPAAQARMYLDANRPDEAIRVLGARLAENPDDAECLRLLAQARLEAHEGALGASNALTAALGALRVEPNDTWAWRLLSICYLRLGSHQESRDAARRARELEPSDWMNHAAVAHADASAHRITDDTRSSVAMALQSAPNQPDVHFAAARVAGASKKWALARAHYGRTLELDPNHVGARTNVAILDMRRGNTGRAAAGFVSILAQNPDADFALPILHALGYQAMRNVYYLLAASLFILNTFGGHAGSRVLHIEGIVVAAVAVAATVSYVAWIRRKAGVYFGRFVRSLPATDKMLTVWAAALMLTLIAIVLAIFLPLAAGAIYLAMQWVLIGSVITMQAVHSYRKNL